MQEDSTELHGGTVREVERDDGLQPGKNKVQRTMMPSGMDVKYSTTHKTREDAQRNREGDKQRREREQNGGQSVEIC